MEFVEGGWFMYFICWRVLLIILVLKYEVVLLYFCRDDFKLEDDFVCCYNCKNIRYFEEKSGLFDLM